MKKKATKKVAKKKVSKKVSKKKVSKKVAKKPTKKVSKKKPTTKKKTKRSYKTKAQKEAEAHKKAQDELKKEFVSMPLKGTLRVAFDPNTGSIMTQKESNSDEMNEILNDILLAYQNKIMATEIAAPLKGLMEDAGFSIEQ